MSRAHRILASLGGHLDAYRDMNIDLIYLNLNISLETFIAPNINSISITMLKDICDKHIKVHEAANGLRK